MSVKCCGQRNTALNSQSQSQLSTSAQGQPLEDKNLVCRACLDTRCPLQVYELLFFVLAVLLKNKNKGSFSRVAQQPTQNTHYKARARNRFLAILQWIPVRCVFYSNETAHSNRLDASRLQINTRVSSSLCNLEGVGPPTPRVGHQTADLFLVSFWESWRRPLLPANIGRERLSLAFWATSVQGCWWQNLLKTRPRVLLKLGRIGSKIKSQDLASNRIDPCELTARQVQTRGMGNWYLVWASHSDSEWCGRKGKGLRLQRCPAQITTTSPQMIVNKGMVRMIPK